MFIHASNTTGLGASQVIISFIQSACKLGLLENSNVYLPSDGPLSNFCIGDLKIIRYKRYLPNSISRSIECLCAKYIFPRNQLTIVLGDLPLRGIKNQIVLVHQPNLVSPKVNPYSSKSFKYRMLRILFRYNIKYAKKIVVQTGVIADELIKSYPSIKDKTFVIPQPAPGSFSLNNENSKVIDRNGPITFFYPAAGYSHKNHNFLILLNDYFNYHGITDINFKVWLTLTEEEYLPYKNITFIKNLGRLNYEEVLKTYNECDALLFLSHSESYGLPLVEAMKFSLPILVVDLDYSKWMCNDKAYYFKHNQIESFLNAKTELIADLLKGISPDYNKELEKFPWSWDEVVLKFIS